MAVTAAKSVMAFRVLTMAVDLCRLTTRTMNVNAGHERTSKARIIHQIQLIRGITSAALRNISMTSIFIHYDADLVAAFRDLGADPETVRAKKPRH
ncbi:Transposase [Shigella dysenteriae 1617]|uniref:Transposase n=2 Tax=Shigella dysenteriae 1617 TaxID=754093 RepID=A0A0A6ZWR3_SHIDY|nr:Transposase [Shigella dysenteriae 1617]